MSIYTIWPTNPDSPFMKSFHVGESFQSKEDATMALIQLKKEFPDDIFYIWEEKV